MGSNAGHAGDAYQGRQTFDRWCTGCHTKDTAKRAVDGAPTLATIVASKTLTPGALRQWLSDPHPPMPKLNLSTLEIENLIAYFEGLRGK